MFNITLPRSRESRLTLLFVISVAASVLASFWCYATYSGDCHLLPPNGPGEWIVYPICVDPGPQKAVERTAVFRRSFVLEAVPQIALLKLCAFTQYAVSLNSVPITASDPVPHAWRMIDSYDLSRQLRHGENILSISVTNSIGPPALSCSLIIGNETIYSDAQWDVALSGAISRPASLASADIRPRRGNRLYGGARTVESLRSCWPIVLSFATLSGSIVAGSYYLKRRFRRGSPNSNAGSEVVAGTEPSAGNETAEAHNRSRLARAFWLVPPIVWLALFVNNDRFLLFPLGFDVKGHLDYIRHIQEKSALPLADEGWELHHPPLYYLAAASILRMFGLSRADPAALSALRGFSVALGISQTLIIFACLRMIFPNERRKQLIGLLVATFLPAHLYVFQYVTNETMVATLGTLAIFLFLRVLRNRGHSFSLHCLLGLCLGAALLAKVTAVLVAAVVLTIMVGQLIVQRRTQPVIWLRTVGLTILICIALSGWHYWRVWQHFGTPFVGNYDAASGFAWWQDPGYSMPVYYLRFGRSLTEPEFSVFHGYLDGFYSTLWGDGLWGGTHSYSQRPPWNYDLMAVGYLLALVLTLAILVGAIAGVVQLVRQPRAELFLLIGVPFIFAVAAVYQHLRFPYYGHAKAIYGLTAATSLCVCAAWGIDILLRCGRVVCSLLVVILGTWALIALASFWVIDTATTRVWQGGRYFGLGRVQDAAKCFESALQRDLNNSSARVGLGRLYLENYRESRVPAERAWFLASAGQYLLLALRDNPNDPELLTLVAHVYYESERIDESLDYLRHACEQGPDYSAAAYYLGIFLEGASFRAAPAQAAKLRVEAVNSYRRGIGISPADVRLHETLAPLLVEMGNLPEAIEHYYTALALDPQNSRVLCGLAWVLATSEDVRFRDGDQAIRLADRANTLARDQNADRLRTLGAAYAESGRHAEAEKVLELALRVAKANSDDSVVTQIERQLLLCKKGEAYRQSPQKIPAGIR
jgi:tetratricopeptide (TPR) repeat protein